MTVERTLAYAIRSERSSDPGLLSDVQQAVWAVNPSLPLGRIETVADIYERSTAQTSFMLVILAVAAGVTVLLGTVGIYGVIAYVVIQRRREVGIRMALGAGPRDVHRLFLGRGLAVVGAGLGVGTAGAAIVSGFLSAMLFEVSPLAPVAYATAVAALGGVAFVAIWVPARAATRIPPGLALRG